MQKCFNWLDLPDHARPFGGQVVIDSLATNKPYVLQQTEDITTI